MRLPTRLVAALACLVASGGSVAILAQQNCSYCQPDRFNYATPNGHYVVCLDHNLPGEVQDKIADGIDYWHNMFAEHNVNISFTVNFGTENATCGGEGDNYQYDILYYVDAGITDPTTGAEAHLTQNMRNSSVGINPYHYTNHSHPPEEWEYLGAHEQGHLLDFKDVTRDGCNGGVTVMWHQTEFMPSGPTCTDRGALLGRWTGQVYTPEDWVSSEMYEDCWDIYLVHIVYWWNGSTYQEIITGATYITWSCDDPPV